MEFKVNVLGASYDVFTEVNLEDDPHLEGADGYTDYTVRKIVVSAFESDNRSVADLKYHEHKVLRHELVHAFLFESGLGTETWARNEEIVDWIAFQFPKIEQLFNQLSI